MNKLFKSIVSLALVCTISFGFIVPNLAKANVGLAEESIKKHEYIMEAENIDIQTGKKSINGNIAFNCSSLVGSDAYIYARNGDISLNVSTANIDGLLYAPNGTVYINGASITINGAIIAKKMKSHQSPAQMDLSLHGKMAGNLLVCKREILR